MHYLMPEHKVLSPLEAEAILKGTFHNFRGATSALVYQDAALKHLRMKGGELYQFRSQNYRCKESLQRQG